MDRHSTPPPAPRAHWTPAKQRIFLAALLDSGSVAHAARAAGMSRSSAHRLRARLAGTPFDRVWGQALAEHARRLADPFADPVETRRADGEKQARP
ncbi:LysR family transcriptional regulator [Sphingomonas bacterium]|uniref:LysR family transcriptional regulator n=1 Tax=Sphingomonas bacterium TaxID=1895847 RepID=UPI002617BB15|nr:LysR family transcriptional regulator [Sphingomonas bacterium]MDB5680043.1 hypothetical protein [Sphingomonas bacterium]